MTFPLRPFLPTDAPILAEIFREAVYELAADDYSEDQRLAWMSAADDEDEFGARLEGQLTLVALDAGEPSAFARGRWHSLDGGGHQDCNGAWREIA
jgi:putative acetyltransferase